MLTCENRVQIYTIAVYQACSTFELPSHKSEVVLATIVDIVNFFFYFKISNFDICIMHMQVQNIKFV